MNRKDIDNIISIICPNDEDFEKPIISPAYLKKELEALALEQEPCTDAVSRKNAVRCVLSSMFLAEASEKIEKLPSVNPQPCDDAISLKDRLVDLANAIENDDSGYWTNKKISSALLRNIEQLPPVTHKSGKWLHKEITDDYRVTGQCSECKERRIIDNFCPNCGAKMESEDKE